MSKPKAQGLSREQIKFLRSRIYAIQRTQWSPVAAPEPVNVRRARSLVNAFDRRKESKEEQRRQIIRTACDEASEAILFASPEEAAQAVRELEERFNVKGGGAL